MGFGAKNATFILLEVEKNEQRPLENPCLPVMLHALPPVFSTNQPTTHTPQADGSSCTPMVVLSYVANGVALYNQLPQGAFTQDELVQLESLPTALDFLLPEDNGRWNLTFFRNATGNVRAHLLNSMCHTPDGSQLTRTDYCRFA
jgi:hypothetical protein